MAIEGPYNFRLGLTKCSTHSISELLDELRLLLSDKGLRPRTLLCLNAHIYNIASKDVILRKILNNARLVVADGVSIVWAARLFGAKIPSRCGMNDTFFAFLEDENMPPNEGILVGLTEDESRLAAIGIEKMSAHCAIRERFSGFLSCTVPFYGPGGFK